MSKITMAAAAAAGYVLGTRAGRERFEQISEKATALWNHPKVQEGAEKAQSVAAEKAPGLKDKVASTMGKGSKDQGQDDLDQVLGGDPAFDGAPMADPMVQSDLGGESYQGGFDSDVMTDNDFTETMPAGEDTRG
jgi:hypothetical protein